MYSVIEFSRDSGGGLAVIRSQWLTPRKKECFWPPAKDSGKFDKILISVELPDTEKWKLYALERIFVQCDDFESARRKLRKAEETPDLQSESGEEERKRKRVLPRRLQIADSSSDEDSSNTLPRPPQIRTVLSDTHSLYSQVEEAVHTTPSTSSTIKSKSILRHVNSDTPIPNSVSGKDVTLVSSSGNKISC
ncbi:uncharacterized protein LOC116167618 isoform X2 [Photinus pyralis]|uniref:uncharacterized protein LOC116159456 isoform X2 n=1 Tax=Photinus pyralis TaxID=7054 RepID=UPI00126718B7|nr:uncharacterized protein LOC116159456 isoform X2 [Photinus pyralis]XP_031338899.1 uncharacterized protein LOC116167618 isoform X2 [Photinus pyralis]